MSFVKALIKCCKCESYFDNETGGYDCICPCCGHDHMNLPDASTECDHCDKDFATVYNSNGSRKTVTCECGELIYGDENEVK